MSEKRNEYISSSLKRDEIVHVGWLTGDENFLSERERSLCIVCVRYYYFLTSEEVQEQE